MIPQKKYYDENRGRDLRLNGERTHWVASEMHEAHHEIARRVALGQKNVDIAKAMNVSPQMVSIVRNSPIVQEQIMIHNGARDADTIDLAKEIVEIAPDAMALLKDIILGQGDGTSASIALRARESNNMLARVGHGVPHKIQAETTNLHLTSKDIEDLKTRALANNDVIEGELL